MTTLTLNTEKIESLILNGYNEKAADEIFNVIEEHQNHVDNELIYRCFSLLNLICDKSPAISLRTVKYVQHFINDPDSWIRLVSLEILYQISLFRPNLFINLISKIRGRLYSENELKTLLLGTGIQKLIEAGYEVRPSDTRGEFEKNIDFTEDLIEARSRVI